MVGFLYGQTEYNILENTMRIDDYVSKASESGYKVLSITDSNMYGHIKFINLCHKAKIKPIIGLEIKLVDDYILGYAYNNLGYKNLLKISSYMMINNTVTLEYLSLYKDGIYFITSGDNNKLINNITCFIDCYNEYKAYLKNVGIGIVAKEEYKALYDIAIKNNIKVFPISRVQYSKISDYKVYEALCKIGNKEVLKKGNYFKDYNTILNEYKDMPLVFECLEKLCNHININLENKKIDLPKYPTPNNILSKDYLKELSILGLEKRLKGSKKDKKIYFNRLNYELDIIDKMGYTDYILIVWDFIKYAKKSGVLVGPGRGSGAGSLVNYAIGITAIDPIEYNLLFERFLNPERITMPDIDTDFPDDKRNMVIDYVKNKYGKNHVCNITTFGTFQVKSSIRDLGRVLKINNALLKEIIALISQVDKGIISYDELILKVKDNEEVYNLLYIAKQIENLPRHISTHAAGIILCDKDLSDIIPLQNGINDLYQSQLEASDLEELGLLKIDFLGIRNLNIIDSIIKNTKELNNINIYNIPLNDKKTFELLSSGDTLGIFQLESKGITEFIKKLKPNCFNDLVAVLALYRPGPMDNIDEFIERKNGKSFSYAHKDLEPILKETYGIIVYQEQIMQIALTFAGYSLGEADILRRAVSKKKEEVLIKERERFVSSSIKKGYDLNTANIIYDSIVKFADYGFNKSHSVAYSLLSYVMAYLKANYKELFINNILSNVIGDITSTLEYIKYAKENGIMVLSPNINISVNKYLIVNGEIYLPLNAIKGIGVSLTNEIIKERENGPFKSLDDFKARININKQALESLIYAGAFDTFNVSKKVLINQISENEVMNKYLEDRIFSIDEFEFDDLKSHEQEVLGYNLVYNLFKNVNTYIRKYNATYIRNVKLSNQVRLIVAFNDIHEVITKNNEIMCVGSIFDGYNELDMVIFPSDYALIKPVINKKNLFVLEGKCNINNRKNTLQIQVYRINKIAE